MRTDEELIAAWKSVASLSSQTENDTSPLDLAAIHTNTEMTIAWLREQAEGKGASAPALHLETTGRRWSPGLRLAAFRALLPELAALDNDEGVVFGLVREIDDNLIRDFVAADYIAILAASGLFKRAQTAMNFLEFAHPSIRCKALLAIASASHEIPDLFAARSSADRLTSIDKVRANMDIFMLTRDMDDLFIARDTARQLEPIDRLIAREHIAFATNDAGDYLKALEAAESITDDAVRFRAVRGVLSTIADRFSLTSKSAISKETLRAIVTSPRLDKYPAWRKSALELLGENN
jgi:hypothetical protein